MRPLWLHKLVVGSPPPELRLALLRSLAAPICQDAHREYGGCAVSGQSYGPSIELCRLWWKTSKTGRQYLVGRLGGAKIVILPRDPEVERGPDHVVLLQEPSGQHQQPHGPRREEPRERTLDDAVPI